MKRRYSVAQPDYSQANAELTRKIEDIEKGLREIESVGANSEAFQNFAQLQMLDIGSAWRLANREQQCEFESFSRRA